MIKHIVFFRLVESAEGKTKSEIAEIIKSGLENLKKFIPEIIKIEVGVNVPNAPKTDYDIALYSEFENFETLDVYQEHPEHKRIAAYIGTVKTSRAAVDYVS
ncbi:MAG: Dabb family protein [Paludibacter sp.]|nr:Dabb family protein [Paludibacter sp.]